MTNEEYIKAIDIRTARRSYVQKPLSSEIVELLKDMVNYVNEKANLNFTFLENGTEAFTVLTGQFSTIAVCGPDSQKAREDCGYYGEMIVLQSAFHGLGTCWVSGTYNENKMLEILNLPERIRLYAVITIGYVKPNKTIKEKTMYSVTHKKNKPYQKMFEFCDKKLPEEYVFAMKMVEKAPSAVNRRPVNFRYENGVISAYVEEPYSDKSIDFGIAKLHFQLGASAKGIKGEWNEINQFITDDVKILKFPNKHSDYEETEGDNKDE